MRAPDGTDSAGAAAAAAGSAAATMTRTAPTVADVANPAANPVPAAADGQTLAARPCRNCGALASTPFCGQCGQYMEHRPLSVRDILSDIAEDQLSVNGSSVRTFSALFRPGLLTQEYLRGRIVRYVAPFRLFLLCTTFFLLMGAFTSRRLERVMVAEGKKAIARAEAQAALDASRDRPVQPFQLVRLRIDSSWMPASTRGLVRPILRKQAQINALPLERSLPIVMRALLRAGSYIIPLFAPLAAVLLALVYGRRHRPFAEHLVFALHGHAFAFVVLGLGMLAQLAWLPLAHLSNVVIVAYLYVALVRVYGDGWVWTVPRLLALAGLYFALMTIANPILQIALLAAA